MLLTDSTNLHFLPLKLSIMARQNAKKSGRKFSRHSILYSVSEYSLFSLTVIATATATTAAATVATVSTSALTTVSA